MGDATSLELSTTLRITSPTLEPLPSTLRLPGLTSGKLFQVLTEPETPSLPRTRPTDTDSCFTAKTEQDSTGTSILTRKTPLSTSQKDSWEEVSHSCQFIREDTS